MPSKTNRKLQAVGKNKASLSVTLPKAWTEFAMLRDKAVVDVFYNGIVVIIPKGNRKLEKEVRAILTNRKTI